jgi:ankyrin repeat protein
MFAIDLLIQKGVDPLQPDKKGNTALHHLARRFDTAPGEIGVNVAYFRRFLAIGCYINAKNHVGETPLFHYMASTGFWYTHEEKIGLFADAEASLFATNNEGQNLLHLIASKSSKDRDWKG